MWKVDDSVFAISTFPYRLYIILMRNNANYKRKGTMSMAIIGIIGDGNNKDEAMSNLIASGEDDCTTEQSNTTNEHTDVETERVSSSDFIRKRFMTVI